MTTTRGRCAVLPDTNVIVDAIVHLHSEEIGVDVSAPRHQEALQMLDAFLGRRSGRCMLSPAVDEEVRRVVERGWRVR